MVAPTWFLILGPLTRSEDLRTQLNIPPPHRVYVEIGQAGGGIHASSNLRSRFSVSDDVEYATERHTSYGLFSRFLGWHGTCMFIRKRVTDREGRLS